MLSRSGSVARAHGRGPAGEVDMTWQLDPGLPAPSRASRGSGVALNRPVPCVGACPGQGGACPFLGTVEDASRKGQKGSGRGGHRRFAITRGRGRSAPRTVGIGVNVGCLEARPPHSWALWLGEVAGPLTLTVLICHWGLSRGRQASVSPKVMLGTTVSLLSACRRRCPTRR